MISFENDNFYVHLYEKADLSGKEITILNYEKQNTNSNIATYKNVSNTD